MQTVASLVSAGTERMLVEFGQANLLGKARQQPDRVRQVVDRARTDGIATTVEAVRSKLAQPIPLGYANAGMVLQVGDEVDGVRVGELVATNGPHADQVCVSATYALPVGAGISAEHACFASIAAVGLQGIRLAGAELGERFVVTGLGLVGLLTVQLLQAHGCEVLGIDPDPDRRQLAASFGAQVAAPADAETTASAFSVGHGVDGVLVCAATDSSEPMRAAGRMCRQRGRVVLVGVSGLDLDRGELYEREISVQVSKSYGAGRHDPSYESGADLPIGLVRWTAGRNMQTVLDLLRRGRLDVGPLITHELAFEDAKGAYDVLRHDRSALGIVLRYQDTAPRQQTRPRVLPESQSSIPSPGGIAVIGAGNFAVRTLIPAIRHEGRDVTLVVARSGISAQLAADAVGAAASTDIEAALSDPSIGAVFIATRHDSHASLAAHALAAGKAVYVEKPLAITDLSLDELIQAVDALGGQRPVLAVGFNRRWAPVTIRMRALLASTSAPKAVVITVNAGAIPRDHWTQDLSVGGGRILGEGCHFVDLARHLVGQPIIAVRSHWLGNVPARDSATLSLSFADGSSAEIHYLANGSPRFPKERVEVFCAGRVMVNDNFRRLRLTGWPRRIRVRPATLDKGHAAAVGAFLAAADAGGPDPIPWSEVVEVSRAAIAAARTD